METYFIIVLFGLVGALAFQMYLNYKKLSESIESRHYVTYKNREELRELSENLNILLKKDKDILEDIELVKKTDYPETMLKTYSGGGVEVYDNFGDYLYTLKLSEFTERAEEIRRICKTNCKKGKK